MNPDREVLEVALEAGRLVLMRCNGNPAMILSVGVAAAITAVGVGIGFGAYKYGHRVRVWLKE